MTADIAELRRLEAEAEKVRRYDPGLAGIREDHAAMFACPDGEYVRYADYLAMRNALPELLKALEEARTPRPKDEWHEDYGDVVWWARFEGEWIGEAAWIGTPNDSDWSGHHTHWTPHPAFPLPPHGGVDVG